MSTDGLLEQRATTLLASMTLEEKAGQLSQYFYLSRLPVQTELVESQIRAGRVGSLLAVADPSETNRLQRMAVAESRLGIPLLFGLDVIHGMRTVSPVPLGMAASWNPDLYERVQAMAAREARSAGVHWTFAPMAEIARDPRWRRYVECGGEDPYLVAQLCAAQVRGFQGAAIGAPEHILAGPKHFIGSGAALGGRNHDEVSLTERELRNIYLPPFAAAIAAGAGNITTSYVGIDGVPGAVDRRLLTELLRGELGFEGFVVSDAKSVMDLVAQGFARDVQAAAVMGLQAGLDMEMWSGMRITPGADPTPTVGAFSALADAVRSGAVDETLVDEAVRRVLRVKLRMGLFEHPYVDEAAAESVVNDPAHREITRIAAEQSAVLLRNEDDTLPLDRSAVRSIAVIGPLADDRPATLGPWVAACDPSTTVTVLEGLRRAAGDGVQITHAAGLALPTRMVRSSYGTLTEALGLSAETEVPFDEAAEFARAVEVARSSDAVVLVLGESIEMNNASRSTLDFPGRQLELLEAVAATGTPVVLVLLSGRPLDLRRAIPSSTAILALWHPGSEGGTAVARILFGDAVPGGRLPFSWPRSVGQIPQVYARVTPSCRPYWEEESTPLYPFGFGLTYGQVEYRDLTLSASKTGLDDAIEATVALHNMSAGMVEEVAQLYLHQRHGGVARPVRELKAFQRVTMKPGETRMLRFTITPAARRYWSAVKRDYVLDESDFDVWVGGDSTAELHAEFVVQSGRRTGACWGSGGDHFSNRAARSAQLDVGGVQDDDLHDHGQGPGRNVRVAEPSLDPVCPVLFVDCIHVKAS